MKTLLVILLAASSFAAEVKLSWEAVPATNLAGYRLYSSTSGGSMLGATNTFGLTTQATVFLPYGSNWLSLTALATNKAFPRGIESFNTPELLVVLAPTTTLSATLRLEQAPTIAGPWQAVTSLTMSVKARSNGFIRGWTILAQGP